MSTPEAEHTEDYYLQWPLADTPTSGDTWCSGSLTAAQPWPHNAKRHVERLVEYAAKIVRFCEVFYPPWTREALLVRLREGVAALREVLPLVRVVLFGSYARGRQTVASDIDLLVVYAGAVRGDAYALVRRTLDLRRLGTPRVHRRGICAGKRNAGTHGTRWQHCIQCWL